MHSLLTLECAACVCFFRKLWVWEKIHSKFVKLWEVKKLLWDCEKGSETAWHKVKPWELRGLWSLRAAVKFSGSISEFIMFGDKWDSDPNNTSVSLIAK